MKTLIKNVTVINPTETQTTDVLFDEKILSVGDYSADESELKIIDGTNKILIPALMDPHVHFRDPGFTYKEDFHTGTAAAAAGGVGTIFDMPNTNPPTFTREKLAEKRAIAESKALVNYGLYFGAGPDNLDEIRQAENVPGTKMYLNVTTGNLKMDDEEQWRKIFSLGKKISLHAEGETFFRAVEIWRELGTPCELHLCHASLASEIELIRQVKADPTVTNRISVEVCPHHLFMTGKERLKYGAFCCMKPPLAEQSDVDALWVGVEDGTIDCFATDHAPHTKEEKLESDIDTNPIYGIPGVETLFQLIFTEFVKRGWSLNKFVKMTSTNIVEVFNIADKKGNITKGYDADFVLIDAQWAGEIKADRFLSKCTWTPFENWKVNGKIEKTFIAGTEVFDGEKITNDLFRGREICFKK
ncbi:hypothetical protein CSB37_04060 [bacterium DOLZORAL124_38_8]|nr:MAG: hypothetical protein CSB37_04060 [bacterium DOLZORAL124_38_8]